MRSKFRPAAGAALFLALAVSGAHAIGISFSYFFPNGGRFASPIAPLGFDDIGPTFGKHFGISTGLNLYNIGGMSVKGVPFSGEDAFTGSFISLNVPLYAKLIVPMGFVKLELKAGGFAFYNFGMQLSKEFDKAYALSLGYAALSTYELKIDNPIGLGWRVGGDLIFYVTETVGISAGVHYLSGSIPLKIRGSYFGGASGGSVVNGTVNFPDAYLDYSGWVISIGGEYNF